MEVQGFQRGLRSRHVSLIALGGIIGSAYFLGTGYVLNQIGPAAFIAYAIGGLITFITMACLAELTAATPSHGSFITYATRFISPSWACGIGWSYWVSWVVFIPSECLAGGILMHSYLPTVSVYVWALLFGMLITLVNLSSVKTFGEVEFWLALIKIALIVSFSVLAIGIFCGWIGSPQREFIGTKYLLGDGGLFPNGTAILFINMVILMANFQGSEIIGLTASESDNPQKDIPKALKKIVFRIVGLYLIPTLLVALIFPWQKANLAGSIFAEALKDYGVIHFAHLFSFLVIAGAISSANSGLYATVRSLHTLAEMHMAPAFFKHLSKSGVPARAAFATLTITWILLVCSHFFSSHKLYANLLAISGFTGAACWVSICWSQLNFRKKAALETLPSSYRVSAFPALTHLGIWLQVGCLAIVAWSPEMRPSFYFGVPTLFIPILLHKWKVHRLNKQ